MHMLSKKDLNFALETVGVSISPTTVLAATGDVQTNDEATVCQRIGFIRDNDASRTS